MFLDARVKLRIGAADMAGPDDALLIEGEASGAAELPHVRFTLPAGSDHAEGCGCCLPRGPVAEALTRLFLWRVRGEVSYFSGVVAVPASAKGEAAIRAALQTDPLITARFRLCE